MKDGELGRVMPRSHLQQRYGDRKERMQCVQRLDSQRTRVERIREGERAVALFIPIKMNALVVCGWH